MTLTDLVEEYLLGWILLSVGVGLAVPRIAVITRWSTGILAVIIGSISLTLSIREFRRIDRRSLGVVLGGHAMMPFFGFAVARLLGLSAPLVVGFVVLGAVTPELVTPVMTELADGNTALSTAAVVVIGLLSVGFIPGVVSLLVDDVAVPTAPIVEQLLVAVVLPMGGAIGLRAWRPERVGRYEWAYPAVSASMVVLIIGGVTAANASVIRSNYSLLVGVVLGALLLNAVGYGLGFVLARGRSRPDRIAATLSVGMRDFAVAAALIIAAGLPTNASLPAVAFGMLEMVTSAGLARWAGRRERAISGEE
ncbi:MAG: bile acid:sodium symporter family protein [Halobacteriaceae archaeon]